MNVDSWLFFQLGAREHYGLPRAFHQRGELAALFTDAWLDPRSPWEAVLGLLPRLASRYEPDLKDARVEHFTSSLLWFEAQRTIKGRSGWVDIIARNKWFQRQAVQRLARTGLLGSAGGGRGIVHAFSYAAHDILAAAKRVGHLTVLGQIDPGIMEEEIVRQACMKRHELLPDWTPAPPEYWDNWREECRLADVIVVNSEWSRRGVVAKGVTSEKVFTIPLVYEAAALTTPIFKSFPNRFDRTNPLTILFLGTICVRKGIAEMLEAIDLLGDSHVRFLFVGPSEVRIPERFRAMPNVQWIGPVARGKVDEYYRDSHVFILPTLSDGFGLTQLEAQALGLPVIASGNCGEVVRHGENGFVLPDVSGASIALAIETILKSPEQLPAMSLRSQEVVKLFCSDNVLPKYMSAAKKAT